MKFIGFVKDNISSIQVDPVFSGAHLHRALIDIEKFPEIVGFPMEYEILHIFKVVDSYDGINNNLSFERRSYISHGRSSFISNILT